MSSFDEDIRDMRRQIIAEVLYTINNSSKLYSTMSGKTGKEIKSLVYNYAKDNNDEIGEVFIVELDVLNSRDWNKIAAEL